MVSVPDFPGRNIAGDGEERKQAGDEARPSLTITDAFTYARVIFKKRQSVASNTVHTRTLLDAPSAVRCSLFAGRYDREE